MGPTTATDRPTTPDPQAPAPAPTPAPTGGGDGRDGLGLALAFGFFAIIGVFVAIAALVVAVGRDDATAAAAPTLVHVSLSEFAVDGTLTAPAGPVTLHVTNDGSQVHNLAFGDGPSTPDLLPGESATLDLGDLAPGTYEVTCLVPGHASAGMVGELVVTEGGGSAAAGGAEAAAGAGHDGHDEFDYAEMGRLMDESIKAFPASTSGRGNQPLEARIGPDGAKEFDVTASIVEWEVAPGEVVEAWAYNGQVPGPFIEVDVGDRVRFNVTNHLPASTDVHFHGVKLPNEMDGVAPITQPAIRPGESFTYEFVAEAPAVAMYHAHHMGQEQVPNGLLGTFIIGDVQLPRGRVVSGVQVPADLQLAAEVPMVLNDAGTIGLSLNGKSFPATDPYVWKVGSWVLVHYLNEGLQVHPMHPHQFPQLVVARDGIPLDQPYFADTLSVAPGERYSVLMHIDRPGTWVWHCHILNHVERETGMFGMATAIVAEA